MYLLSGRRMGIIDLVSQQYYMIYMDKISSIYIISCLYCSETATHLVILDCKWVSHIIQQQNAAINIHKCSIFSMHNSENKIQNAAISQQNLEIKIFLLL